MPEARHNQRVGDSYGRYGYIRSIVGHIAHGTTSLVPTDALHRQGGKGCALLLFGGAALSILLTTGAGAWIL